MFTWLDSARARLHSPLARHLKQAYDVSTVALTFTRDQLPSSTQVDFDERDFAEIIEVLPHLRARPKPVIPKPAELTARLSQLEERYGVNLIDVIRTDRHFGIGFVSGCRFLRSRMARAVDYEQSLDIVARLIDVFAELLAKYQPVVVLSGAGSIGPATLTAIARGMRIPMRTMIRARHGIKLHWTVDWEGEIHGLQQAFAAHYDSPKTEPENTLMDDPETHGPEPGFNMFHAQRSWEVARLEASLQHLITSIVPRMVRRIRTDLADMVKRRERSLQYLLRDYLWDTIEHWYWLRTAVAAGTSLESIPSGISFVYYPLHTEPESDLMAQAQMSNHQITHVDWLAKTIPSGWYLVVKEHPHAHAARPRGFWDSIGRYPNVIVPPPFSSSQELTECSQAVAIIHGTSGVGAALAGKPVITFHPRFIGLNLPHVFHADSYESTYNAVRTIAAGRIGDPNSRQAAIYALRAALDDCAFPVRTQSLLEGRRGDTAISPEDVETIAHTLFASLEDDVSVSQRRNVVAARTP